jgi:hypothetical protein
MPELSWLPVWRGSVRVLTALLLVALASPAGAVLIVEGTVSPAGGGLFHYEFTVTNDTPDDVILVSLVDGPLNDLDLDASLVAPPDYLASYDPGLGIVDFLEASALFAAFGSVGGFAFDTSAGPESGFFTTFEAFTALGDPLNGDVVLIPEPSTFVLLLTGLAALATRTRRMDARI